MTVVELPKQRHSIQEEGLSLRISIPSRKNFFTTIFLGFWLIGWAFGEIGVGGTIAKGVIQALSKIPEILSQIGKVEPAALAGISGVGLFMLVWFLGWTAGGAFAIYTFLWQLAGRENIEVSNDRIRIQQAIFGFGRSKEYPAAQIKDLRVTPRTADNSSFGWSRSSNYWGTTGGLIAFDYGAKTFRFGGGVDEAEAKQILEEIISRYPQYRARS